MRGEGFNPEISREAAAGGAAEQIKTKERTLLETLRKGVERHRMALLMAFTGALAESMSGTAKAQESEKPIVVETASDEVMEKKKEEVEADAEWFAEQIDDLRAPYLMVEGFDEVLRIQEMSDSESGKDDPTIIVQRPGGRLGKDGIAGLTKKRIVVTAATGVFADFTHRAEEQGGERTEAAHLNEVSKTETALYATEASEINTIEKAESFQTVGWGSTPEQALANALHEAALSLTAWKRVEGSGYTESQGKYLVNDKPAEGAKSTFEQREVRLAHETGAVVIEGFTITKTGSAAAGEDGAMMYFAHVEGLGTAVDKMPDAH